MRSKSSGAFILSEKAEGRRQKADCAVGAVAGGELMPTGTAAFRWGMVDWGGC